MAATDSTADLKDGMVRAARRAYAIRLQSGDGGNLSIRVPGRDAMLIKASGASFGDMDYDDIIEVSLDGEVSSCEGGKPSRESETHLAIYRCRKDVSAIFHCHSPWSVVASLSFDAWPPVSLPLEMKIGSVPVVDFGEGHADRKVADHVADLMIAKPELKAFVQRRHGLFCLSTGIIKAEHDAELVEEAAQIAVLGRMVGVTQGTA